MAKQRTSTSKNIKKNWIVLVLDKLLFLNTWWKFNSFEVDKSFFKKIKIYEFIHTHKRLSIALFHEEKRRRKDGKKSFNYLVYVLVGLDKVNTQLPKRRQRGISEMCGNSCLHCTYICRRCRWTNGSLLIIKI